MPQPTPDLTGQRFGRLLVLERDYEGSRGHAAWRCRCDCGTERTVASSSLRKGGTRSCGCLKSELTVARNFKHGLMTRKGRSPTFNSWANMIRRCTNPDDPRWPDWGGRGIRVCDRWREYAAFLADMGERPAGMSIDRIDNDGDYEPGNCRWATARQQHANKGGVKLNQKMVLRIQQLYAQGLAVGVIAEKVDLRRQTVGTVCTVLDALADG